MLHCSQWEHEKQFLGNPNIESSMSCEDEITFMKKTSYIKKIVHEREIVHKREICTQKRKTWNSKLYMKWLIIPDYF